MKLFSLRAIAILGVIAAGGIAPTAALAQNTFGIFFFNDGSGTCGYVSCGAYGCSVIDTFPCPREVDEGGG